ncbi:lipid II flippase Amj family protein [Tsuneonella sp. YG55]|uniref:Lipid II flippase Amj n=1 Tax=Tsuneonella litorea TaxID=2976475 RepID=A0A9X3AN37_9SPHN|nr:lipid II flippase Amj family protein [Tsuneonella litorea]MCT2559157.1 lipid II flippase Amj family protein [Tsuneonella litorea]
MDAQLAAILILTVIINLIGTLAYAARIAGVRTRRIAMSFALFNALVLVSRLSNGFLGPLIANRVEQALAGGGGEGLLGDFRLFMLAATVGVVVGIALVPSTQRLFARVIGGMQKKKSLAELALRSVTPAGLRTLREAVTIPSVASLRSYTRPAEVSWGILFANCLAQAILVVGVLASIYAGYLVPEYRVTASQLSALINGFATILLFLVIDPQLSVLTDDVVDGQVSEPAFRRAILWISGSRLAGTLLAQALFVPAAIAIAWAADLI